MPGAPVPAGRGGGGGPGVGRARRGPSGSAPWRAPRRRLGATRGDGDTGGGGHGWGGTGTGTRHGGARARQGSEGPAVTRGRDPDRVPPSRGSALPKSRVSGAGPERGLRAHPGRGRERAAALLRFLSPSAPANSLPSRSWPLPPLLAPLARVALGGSQPTRVVPPSRPPVPISRKVGEL